MKEKDIKPPEGNGLHMAKSKGLESIRPNTCKEDRLGQAAIMQVCPKKDMEENILSGEQVNRHFPKTCPLSQRPKIIDEAA